MKPKLEIVFEPESALVEQLDGGLVAFNVSQIGGWACHHIAVFARNDGGKVIGGIYGTAQWDWFEIEIAWVEESERQRGVGSLLLGTIEKTSADKNYLRFHVRTGSWQALTFYQNHGYEVFGQLADYPKGHTTYFLKKEVPGSS